MLRNYGAWPFNFVISSCPVIVSSFRSGGFKLMNTIPELSVADGFIYDVG